MDEDLDIDMSAAISQMGDTFAGEGGGNSAQDESGDASETPPPTPAPEAAAPAEAQPAANPWDALPKSWRKDYEADWKNFRPEFRQYAHEREKQMLDGLMGYKSQLEPYSKMEQHYKPYLEQYGMNMPQVTERMINSHLALLYADDNVKANYLQGLVRDYKLEPLLRQMFGGQTAAPSGQQPAADPTQQIIPQVQRLVQEAVAPIRGELQRRQQAEQQAQLEAMTAEIDKFISDPQNPYAAELVEDMVRVVQGGLASSLKDAYDMASRLNPAVAKKIMDAEVVKLTKPSAPAIRNVRSGSTPPASTSAAPGGDIEDTMRQVYKDIQSR